MNLKTKLLFIVLFLIGCWLRFFALAVVPPSLYWEEVALGYDSYSILQTARDHHGNFLPVVAFESFGDWKPSLYFYYLVPYIAAFGLTDFAIRLAAAMVGLLVLIGIPVLAKQNNISPLISLAVVCISPWAVIFSRVAWEAHLATALILWGIIFLQRAIKGFELKYLLSAAVLLGLSMYAYHAARVIAPLLSILIAFSSADFRKELNVSKDKLFNKKRVRLIISLLVLLVLVFPLLWATIRHDISVTQRFNETNIFSDISIIEKSNTLKEQSSNSLISRILYHRYILFAEVMTKNIFSYFTINYLFVDGDINPRHHSGNSGIFYYSDLLMILVAIYWLTRKNKNLLIVLLGWIFITLLPASITTANPHSLRTLIALPASILLISAGLEKLFSYLKSHLQSYKILKNFQTLIVPLFVIMYAVQFLAFWRYYTKIYPIESAGEWQYGYQEMVNAVTNAENRVYISREIGRPAMYYWFYTQTDPKLVQAENQNVNKDQSEFLSFNNVIFINSISKIDNTISSTIAVSDSDSKKLAEYFETSSVTLSETHTVSEPDGTVVWRIFNLTP